MCWVLFSIAETESVVVAVCSSLSSFPSKHPPVAQTPPAPHCTIQRWRVMVRRGVVMEMRDDREMVGHGLPTRMVAKVFTELTMHSHTRWTRKMTTVMTKSDIEEQEKSIQ